MTPPPKKKNIKRTVGSESRTQVLASYCTSDVIDPGSSTHTSPEGSGGILGLGKHMTNCSELLHKHISAGEVIYSLPNKWSLREEQQMFLSIRTVWLQWHKKTPDSAFHCTSNVLFITADNFQDRMQYWLIDFLHLTLKSWMFVFLKSTHGYQKVLFSFIHFEIIKKWRKT